MSFIESDEFILIIEDQRGRKYTQDDLKKLYDAGIRTIIHYPFWRNIEKWIGGYDWESVDKWVYESRQAGLKTMLSVYQHPPDFFPDDWYLKRISGERYTYSDDYVDYERIMSPWSADGWKYHLDFIDKFCKRNNAPDVLCFDGVVQGGSVMLPEALDVRVDGDMLSTVLRMARDEQAIFSRGGEIWTGLHPAFDTVQHTGNQYRDEIYGMLKREFPEASRNILIYTYFTELSRVWGKAILDEAQRTPTWTGSEYAEGLALNTDEAIRLGFRGFVCAPIHALTGHYILEDWILDAIRESLSKWRKTL